MAARGDWTRVEGKHLVEVGPEGNRVASRGEDSRLETVCYFGVLIPSGSVEKVLLGATSGGGTWVRIDRVP